MPQRQFFTSVLHHLFVIVVRKEQRRWRRKNPSFLRPLFCFRFPIVFQFVFERGKEQKKLQQGTKRNGQERRQPPQSTSRERKKEKKTTGASLKEEEKQQGQTRKRGKQTGVKETRPRENKTADNALQEETKERGSAGSNGNRIGPCCPPPVLRGWLPRHSPVDDSPLNTCHRLLVRFLEPPPTC